MPASGAYVFGRRGTGAYGGYSKAKRLLDEQMLVKLREASPNAELKPYVLHDLRRTARSLISRAGVRSEIAERVLNHTIPGVRGVYDRHSYIDEKWHALESLAALVAQIVKCDDNVIALREQRA